MAANIERLLERTSRTFALAIPLLPEPTRRAVSIAYLLFRVADTLEDATSWVREARLEALRAFGRLLRLGEHARDQQVGPLVEGWLAAPPVAHAGYLELLGKTPDLLRALGALTTTVRRILVRHAARTADGMASIVARADDRGDLRLASVGELRDYCYVVAGIVGELLTELFLHDTPALESARPTLEARMVSFGEGLQLVNILKDAGDDAREGRVFLPPGVPRGEIIALARADLDEANEYVKALQSGGAPAGYLGFTGIALLLAYKALELLDAEGPGAKLSRAEVGRLMGLLQARLASGAPLDVRACALT